MIHHLKSFPGEIYFHLLTDDGVEVKRFLIFLTPLGIVLTKLSV